MRYSPIKKRTEFPFIGTRVPVGVLFENLAAGASLDEILENFPSPRREQAIEAIREATTIIEQSAIPSSSPLFDEGRAG